MELTKMDAYNVTAGNWQGAKPPWLCPGGQAELAF